MNSAVDDLSLRDLYLTLTRERRFFAAFVFAGIAISALIAFSLPRYFVASTVVLPPQQQNSSLQGALAQLNGLASFAGGTSLKSPEDLYVALFQTRNIQDRVIEKFGLMKRYEEVSLESARQTLASRASVSADKKTGLITIEYYDASADLAAEIANSYVDEMRKMLTGIALTEAQQRQAFLEDQARRAEAALEQAETAFLKAQKSTGFAVPETLADLGIRESAQIRAALTAKELELKAVAGALAPGNPVYKRLVAEISAMQEKIRALEEGRVAAEGGERGRTPSLPLYREMKLRQAVLEQLLKQLEAAKFDVAKEGPLLQQIDIATPPERPAKPRRSSIMVLGVLISVFLASGFALRRGFRRV